MIKLDLKAESPELEALKSYLEENVSQILADKINKGVRIEKDGKTLINKKTLETFMNYAQGEAQKLAAKGARYACIKSDIVFGWAIHYFEEDNIEGTLYNEDGTPYKPAPKTVPKPVKSAPATVVSKPAKPESKQFTLFDLVAEPTPKVEEKTLEIDTKQDDSPDFDVDMETGEIISRKPQEKPKDSGLYQQYMHYVNVTPNAVVIMRIGDFYEIFGERAVDIGNKLELTITGRDCGLEERVPMIGFPYHAADNYIRKIRDFYNVFIVDGTSTKFLPYAIHVDDDDEYEDELSEEEMREFDGDIDEEIPIETDMDNNDDNELNDIEYMKYIDKDAFMVLVEFLDDKLDVQ